MMTPNTSRERIDALTHVSDQIYPILEERVDGEIRARRIMRLGISSVAIALRHGMTRSQAGASFDSYLAHELRAVDYGSYESHQTVAVPLHELPPLSDDLAKLANDYSDTLRGTELADHTREPDAIHALHLTALAVPYARAHYPDLDSGKVALYSPLHDLTEAVIGDVPTFNISEAALQQKKHDEEQAIQTLRLRYGNTWPELIDAIEDYESLADDEAIFVKSMDKNDPGYTHFRNNAHALRTRHGVDNVGAFLAQSYANTARTFSYAGQFPLVLEDKYELTNRIATYIDKKSPADGFDGAMALR